MTHKSPLQPFKITSPELTSTRPTCTATKQDERVLPSVDKKIHQIVSKNNLRGACIRSCRRRKALQRPALLRFKARLLWRFVRDAAPLQRQIVPSNELCHPVFRGFKVSTRALKHVLRCLGDPLSSHSVFLCSFLDHHNQQLLLRIFQVRLSPAPSNALLAAQIFQDVVPILPPLAKRRRTDVPAKVLFCPGWDPIARTHDPLNRLFFHTQWNAFAFQGSRRRRLFWRRNGDTCKSSYSRSIRCLVKFSGSNHSCRRRCCF